MKTPRDIHPDRGDDTRNNLLFTDPKELLYRALEECGYPSASVQALREHGDPRPRLRLPDGPEIIAQHVPPLPPEERVEDEFFRLVAEECGLPIDGHRKNEVREAVMETYGAEWKAVLGGMVWPEPDKENKYARRALNGAWDRLYEALADIPEPGEPWYDRWARKAWKEFRGVVGWGIERAVFGEKPRQGEQVKARTPGGGYGRVSRRVEAKNPDTGEPTPFDPDPPAALTSEYGWRQAAGEQERSEERKLIRAEIVRKVEAARAAGEVSDRQAGVFLKSLDSTAKEIADDLGVKPSTVRTHRERAVAWARNRPDLMALLDDYRKAV